MDDSIGGRCGYVSDDRALGLFYGWEDITLYTWVGGEARCSSV